MPLNKTSLDVSEATATATAAVAEAVSCAATESDAAALATAVAQDALSKNMYMARESSERDHDKSSRNDVSLYSSLLSKFSQPPAPVERMFDSVEDAKSYLVNYMAHTNTKLVIYRSNKQRGTINYRCALGWNYGKRAVGLSDSADLAGEADDNSNAEGMKKRKLGADKECCRFKVFIKYDKYEDKYRLTVPMGFHSHPVLSVETNMEPDMSVVPELSGFVQELVQRDAAASLDTVKSMVQKEFPETKFDDATLRAELDFALLPEPEEDIGNEEKFYTALRNKVFTALQSNTTFQNLGELGQYAYMMLQYSNVQDTENLKFLLNDRFPEVKVDDKKVNEIIELCNKARVLIEPVNAQILPTQVNVATTRDSFVNDRNIDPEIAATLTEAVHTELPNIDKELLLMEQQSLQAAQKNEKLTQVISDPVATEDEAVSKTESQSNPSYGMVPSEQMFVTMEEAKEFLDKYSKDTKIGLVIYKSGNHRGYTYYRCEKGGNPEENFVKRKVTKTEPARRRRRSSKKMGCPFKIHVNYEKRERQYKLTVPVHEHNHPLGVTDIKDSPVLRKRTEEHLKYMRQLYLSGVTKPQFIKRRMMKKFPDLEMIDKDVYNDLRKLKQQLKAEQEAVNTSTDNDSYDSEFKRFSELRKLGLALQEENKL